MEDGNRHVGMLLKRLTDAVDRKSNISLHGMDMTRSQIHVLLVLEQEEDNTLSFTKLKNQLGVAQPTAWGLIRRLEAKDMVRTLPNPNDKRSKLVTMTDTGHDAFDRAFGLMGKIEDVLIKNLDDEDLERLRGYLTHMLDNCEKLDIRDLA